jgi:calpain-15
VHVTVDTYVPVLAKRDVEPCFVQSVGFELWVVLLEKAVAKSFGGYDRLMGGNPWFAMQLLTG